MKLRTFTSAFTLLTLATAGVLFAWQDQGGPPAAKPGKEHELLMQMAGTWEATFRMSMPGMPPIESKATETNELAMNGLWLISSYEDPNMGGTVFHGHGITGYDQDKKKYVGAWVDTMSSALSVSEGSYDEKTKTLTMTSEGKDPMSGKAMTSKSTTVVKDADTHMMAMKSTSADGKEVESFTIEYKRKK